MPSMSLSAIAPKTRSGASPAPARKRASAAAPSALWQPSTRTVRPRDDEPLEAAGPADRARRRARWPRGSMRKSGASSSAARTATAAFSAWCAPAQRRRERVAALRASSGEARSRKRRLVRRRSRVSSAIRWSAAPTRRRPRPRTTASASGSRARDERGPAARGRRPPSRRRSRRSSRPRSSMWSSEIDVTTERMRRRDVGRVEAAAEPDLEDREIEPAVARRRRTPPPSSPRSTSPAPRAPGPPPRRPRRAPRRAPPAAMSSAPIRIRSVTSIEVRRRVEARPQARRRARSPTSVAAVEPFPLVPATRTDGTRRSGRPRRSQTASIAARPSLMPRRSRDSRRSRCGRRETGDGSGTLRRRRPSRRLTSAASQSRRRHRPSVAFISERSTMKSSIPCSSRNSERWKPSGSVWRIVCSITRGPAKPISALGSAMFRSPSIA